MSLSLKALTLTIDHELHNLISFRNENQNSKKDHCQELPIVKSCKDFHSSMIFYEKLQNLFLQEVHIPFHTNLLQYMPMFIGIDGQAQQ